MVVGRHAWHRRELKRTSIVHSCISAKYRSEQGLRHSCCSCCPLFAAQEPAVAQRLLGEAAQRLRESISFDRGDVAPHNALGDALMAQAEQLAASDVQAAAAAAAAALQEGYLGALRINAACPEGLVGAAEAHVQLARLAGGSVAAQHWAEAAAAYAAALAKPQGLGKWEDRCDVRYNYACCLAQLGRAEEAATLLRQLVAAGAVTAADIRQDADLAVLHASFS